MAVGGRGVRMMPFSFKSFLELIWDPGGNWPLHLDDFWNSCSDVNSGFLGGTGARPGDVYL